MPAAGARDDVDGLVDYYKNTFAEASDEISLTNITQIAHYQSNVASLMLLGYVF